MAINQNKIKKYSKVKEFTPKYLINEIRREIKI